MFHKILGYKPWCWEADPNVIKKGDVYHLYSNDLIGIKESISHDGIHFRFHRRIAVRALRSYVTWPYLYYEKHTNLRKFPFYQSHLRRHHLITGEDTLVLDEFYSHASPSLIGDILFFSTGYQQMDYWFAEPTTMKRIDKKPLTGLEHITSLRQFGSRYFGTHISVRDGKSTAKIVECFPKNKFCTWTIGKDILTPREVSPRATHVYVPSFVDGKLYFNVRFGRSIFASEWIMMTELPYS